jgi:hypothetical protein
MRVRWLEQWMLLAALVPASCLSRGTGPSELVSAEIAAQGPGLAVIAAELQLHLRDDTYRYDRARGADGRNVFAVALWRLERLQQSRTEAGAPQGNADLVIEYARGRALERLRRYPEALEAYDRVASAASMLEASASEARDVISRFARNSAAPLAAPATPEDELAWIDARIEKWSALAWEYRRTTYEPLAREELEAWEQLRVEWHVRHAPAERAIDAARRLVDRHRESKLYAEHLIRLGDLYAAEAREQYARHRVRAAALDSRRYDDSLDQALSAYELAAQQRRPESRRQARSKIGALLAYHQGVRADAP